MAASLTPSQLDALRLALPRLLGNLDEKTFEAVYSSLPLEWVERAAGEVLFREGEPSDALFLLISGRLQASVTSVGGVDQVVGEIGRGESVGEMGVLSNKPRRATVIALRDSVLARIELSAFNELLETYPSLALKLTSVIIERLERRNTSQKSTHNVTNLAVVSISDGLAPRAVLDPLLAELQRHRAVLHLTSEMIDAAAGRPGAAQATEAHSEANYWLVNYLDDLESRYALVFYETDPTPTAWTRRCLRQADEVLLLGKADATPGLSQIERDYLTGAQPLTPARQTLVLLHPADAEWASGTPEFRAARPAVTRHHHLRSGQAKDVARLARFLSGKAVGLVLAGGGARGIAHIGVFRALDEAGVAIDSVGGTSIGSVLAACKALDWGWERISRENRSAFMSNPTSDFNLLPLASLLAGRKLDRILTGYLGTRQIDEMWLPFFCVSSSYTRACEVVHTSGNIKRALLASMAIPGVFPPIVSGNDLLMDGEVFNNMPVDVMARSGVSYIMAVDLRRDEKQRHDLDFDRVPGTWALLRDRFKAKTKRRYQIPSMITALMAANNLNSKQKMSQVVADVDLLFNPDVRRFGLLEWKSYDLLVEEGYRHAQEVLAKHRPPV